MSWGYRITFLYVGFVALILTLVFMSTNVNIDLVEEDYYAKEVAYQEQIERIKNTQALPTPVSHEITDTGVRIQFPEGSVAEGTVTFFRPSNKKLDLTLPLELDANAVMDVSRKQLLPGRYILKMDWTMNDKEYYYESGVFF